MRKLRLVSALALSATQFLGCNLNEDSEKMAPNRDDKSAELARVSGFSWHSIGLPSGGLISALAISGAANNNTRLWTLSDPSIPGGYTIKTCDAIQSNCDYSSNWVTTPGGLQYIAGGQYSGTSGAPNTCNGGYLWGVNVYGSVYQRQPSGTWNSVGNEMRGPIAVGGPLCQDVYVLSTESTPGGFKIYKWKVGNYSTQGRGSWDLISGGARYITVATNGDLWALNDNSDVYLRPANTNSWQSKGHGYNYAISAGNPDQVYSNKMVNPGLAFIVKYNNATGSWDPVTPQLPTEDVALSLAVDAHRDILYAKVFSGIYRQRL